MWGVLYWGHKPMRETLRHQEAFDFYYSLGNNRTIAATARHYSVSRGSVFTWSRKFNWQERIRERDASIAKKVQDITDADIVKEKSALLKMVKKTLDNANSKVTTDNIGIRNQFELLSTIKTTLELLGEPERVELSGGVKWEISEDFVPAVMAKGRKK